MSSVARHKQYDQHVIDRADYMSMINNLVQYVADNPDTYAYGADNYALWDVVVCYDN